MGVRRGYDLWSSVYEERTSTLVALDRRVTPPHLQPRPGERILDAGCGTGAHLAAMIEAGAIGVGVDFSAGMLAVARRLAPRAALIQADLNLDLPLVDRAFDAVLCSLVSEHLASPARLFVQLHRVLRPGGKIVFSAFHPDMAAAGVEANFEIDGRQVRLGAELHDQDDYLEGLKAAGFHEVSWREYRVDEELVAVAPSARKHLGQPLLLMIDGERRT